MLVVTGERRQALDQFVVAFGVDTHSSSNGAASSPDPVLQVWSVRLCVCAHDRIQDATALVLCTRPATTPTFALLQRSHITVLSLICLYASLICIASECTL